MPSGRLIRASRTASNTCSSDAPGSRRRLPVPRPLGTVRASVPAHGSSTSKGCDTRWSVATMVSDADHCTPATAHLRDTHLQPVDCRGGLFPCSRQPKAHQQVALPSFAFLPRTGSSSSLATKHQMDVSTVSGQAMEPYLLHYRAAFASSILPPPHPQQRPSRVACPSRGGDTRVAVFRVSTQAA